MENLLLNLKRKDKLAFKELYYSYNKLLYYVALSLVKDINIANDIVSDTFLNFMEHIDKLEDINIKSYLTTSCKNLCLNYLNKNKRNINIEDILYKEGINTHNKIDLQLTLDEVLTKDEALIVTLKIIHNYTFKNISEDFNINIDKVKNTYYKAVGKLKEYYKEVN